MPTADMANGNGCFKSYNLLFKRMYLMHLQKRLPVLPHFLENSLNFLPLARSGYWTLKVKMYHFQMKKYLL